MSKHWLQKTVWCKLKLSFKLNLCTYRCVCCQCNASCGRGVRLRQVVCAGLEAGVFKEWPDSRCEQAHRPESISPCFQRPCSKWFTTAWSQVIVSPDPLTCTRSDRISIACLQSMCWWFFDLIISNHSKFLKYTKKYFILFYVNMQWQFFVIF